MRLSIRIVGWLGLGLLVVALGDWGGTQLFVRVFAETDLHVRPYIAEDTQFYIQGGKEVVMVKDILARRRDGALRKTSTFYQADGSQGMVLSRVEFPNGYMAMVADSVLAKSTGRRPSLDVAAAKSRLLNPPPQCAYTAPKAGMSEIVDGEDVLFGFPAYRVVRQLSEGKRYISWRLPDFQCAALQSFVQTFDKASSSWQTTMGKRLTGFAEANPDPRIFTDWNMYSEMKPSDLKRAVYSNSGVSEAECPKCFADDSEADTNYEKFQAQ